MFPALPANSDNRYSKVLGNRSVRLPPVDGSPFAFERPANFNVTKPFCARIAVCSALCWFSAALAVALSHLFNLPASLSCHGV